MTILQGKLLETSFLGASVEKSFIIDSDLTDCLLLNASGQFSIQGGVIPVITRPVIALCWNFRERGVFTAYIDEALRDIGGIPLKIEIEPLDIDINKLKLEVQQGLLKSHQNTSVDMLSIPDALLKSTDPASEIEKIKKKTASALKFCNGLVLPGGKDIQPEFYDAVKEDDTDIEADYRHSMVEFSLLFHANNESIPTMGICRGSQIINIYFGGTLKQHVTGHASRTALQMLKLANSSRREEFRILFGGDVFPAMSAHHQASDRIGKNLEVILEYEGIPKLLVSSDNLFIACQVHPELYIRGTDLAESLQAACKGKIFYEFFLKTVHNFSNLRRLIEVDSSHSVSPSQL